jgi:hypothetical protein
LKCEDFDCRPSQEGTLEMLGYADRVMAIGSVADTRSLPSYLDNI